MVGDIKNPIKNYRPAPFSAASPTRTKAWNRLGGRWAEDASLGRCKLAKPTPPVLRPSPRVVKGT